MDDWLRGLHRVQVSHGRRRGRSRSRRRSQRSTEEVAVVEEEEEEEEEEEKQQQQQPPCEGMALRLVVAESSAAVMSRHEGLVAS